jgi:hypothetical protein
MEEISRIRVVDSCSLFCNPGIATVNNMYLQLGKLCNCKALEIKVFRFLFFIAHLYYNKRSVVFIN